MQQYKSERPLRWKTTLVLQSSLNDYDLLLGHRTVWFILRCSGYNYTSKFKLTLGPNSCLGGGDSLPSLRCSRDLLWQSSPSSPANIFQTLQYCVEPQVKQLRSRYRAAGSHRPCFLAEVESAAGSDLISVVGKVNPVSSFLLLHSFGRITHKNPAFTHESNMYNNTFSDQTTNTLAREYTNVLHYILFCV